MTRAELESELEMLEALNAAVGNRGRAVSVRLERIEAIKRALARRRRPADASSTDRPSAALDFR